ncbi:hypothetical protein DYQ86_16085 [Acidobacteria bacterium AB60]|nr:hypothetical protein DYQ86_16085 [Acidobacteria bacterium AB60]
MKQSEMFWAFVVALILASADATIAYIFPGTDAARHDMAALASDMVTGALGFFAGRAMAAAPSKAQDETQS